MSKNQRSTARKPATRFAHLQKKMRNQKTQSKKADPAARKGKK